MAETKGAATFRTSAEAYDRHIGRYGPALARALVAAANVSAGQRALDVGCGPGALTAVLADVLGSDRVAAVDPSEPFVATCAQRLPGVDVRAASAEARPFPDHSFDATLAQLAVNFMNDPPAGVGEMRRVTRPGGAVGAAIWDYASEMTILRRFWDAAVSLDPDAADRDEGRCMPYCTPEDLERLWRDAGLQEPAVSTLDVDAEYNGFDDLWRSLEQGSGPSTAYAASLPAAAEARRRSCDFFDFAVSWLLWPARRQAPAQPGKARRRCVSRHGGSTRLSRRPRRTGRCRRSTSSASTT